MVFGQSNLAAVMLHLHVYKLNSRFWRKLERLVVKVAAWKDKPVETVDQYDLREWVEFVNCQNLARNRKYGAFHHPPPKPDSVV